MTNEVGRTPQKKQLGNFGKQAKVKKNDTTGSHFSTNYFRAKILLNLSLTQKNQWVSFEDVI